MIRLVALLAVLAAGVSAQKIPDGPKPQHAARIVDGKFVALHVLGVAAMVANVEVTQHALSGSRPCREANSIYGPRPSRAKMYAINVPVQLALIWVSRWARSKGSSAWWVPAILPAGARGAVMAHDAASCW